MPVNTRSKRASSVQVLMPFILAPVLPDGAISAADRQHIAWMYSGILAGAAAGGTDASRIYAIDAEARVWGIAAEVRVFPVDGEVRVMEVR